MQHFSTLCVVALVPIPDRGFDSFGDASARLVQSRLKTGKSPLTYCFKRGDAKRRTQTSGATPASRETSARKIVDAETLRPIVLPSWLFHDGNQPANPLRQCGTDKDGVIDHMVTGCS